MNTRVFLAAGLLVLAGGASAGDSPTPLDRTVELDRQRALVAEDFAKAAGSMKVAIAEYYMSTGKLPTSNKQSGLPDPEDYRGHTLLRATVRLDGAIEMTFDAHSGKAGGRIRLIPELAHANAMGVQWRCESPDYAQIRRIIPTCDFVRR